MKKKALIIAALVVGLATTGWYASRALFSDTETSADNTFTVGTLDLEVGAGGAFDTIAVNNVGADGTVSGTKSWVITNTGSVPGNLTFQVNDVMNYENGCNEPEAIVDSTCDPALTDDGTIGEFGNALTVNVGLDAENDGSFEPIVASNMANASQSEYATQWNTAAGTVTLEANESVTVKLDWSTDPTAYGNEIQSDSLDFGLQFDLLQVVPQ